ncbi:MAG: YebC/PmpR family DNA-binding transcriptional regulator [Eubacteriales bacterium]|jgi:YebC/PmpR family DNA-binding regulatory protein
MSGHSKWKNIMHKKGKTDAQRAKVFTKIGIEITVCVKEGGPNPASNTKLRDLIAKAKRNNVPNDNIERCIKKASGADSADYLDMLYEGYGVGGIAVMVETLTDNKNRTAGNLRHYFDKFGASLGTSGSVSWQFEKKGSVVIEDEGVDEDAITEAIFDSGAMDFSHEDGAYEIETLPEELHQVRDFMEEKGYKIASCETGYFATNTVDLTNPDDVEKMQKLLEALEDDDDVQNVYHNWGNEPEEEEE